MLFLLLHKEYSAFPHLERFIAIGELGRTNSFWFEAIHA